jgi:hypothetical protein
MDRVIKKYNYELLFHDSPEYFYVNNARMMQEKDLIRFICFDDQSKYLFDMWFPVINIHRIKRTND